jgi:hypothetical protein
MHFSSSFISILYAIILALVGLSTAAPLCSDTINTAGGGPPNSGDPTFLSENAVKEFQLALFLENLESSYFQSGLQNISQWGTDGDPNDTVEIISKIAAVSPNVDRLMCV